MEKLCPFGVLFSILLALEKAAVHMICSDDIYKCLRICFPDFSHHQLHFIAGYHGINHTSLLVLIRTLALKYCGSVVRTA